MLDENIEKLSSDEGAENTKEETANEVEKEVNKLVEKEEDSSGKEKEESIVDQDQKESDVKAEVLEKEEAIVDQDQKESDVKAEVLEKEESIVDQDQKESDVKAEVLKKNAVEEEAKPVEDVPSEKPEIKEEKKEIPVLDIEKMDLDELVDAIQNLLSQFPVEHIKVQIESLKSAFVKKFKVYLAEKKEAFIKEGGNEIDFHFTSPVKNKFNDLIFEYKKKRQQFYKDIEKNQKENLQKRLQLIDQLKELIDNAEASTMYKEFRELQDEWRVAGQIPHTKYPRPPEH